jgi:Iap family predicted aminopeptidase
MYNESLSEKCWSKHCPKLFASIIYLEDENSKKMSNFIWTQGDQKFLENNQNVQQITLYIHIKNFSFSIFILIFLVIWSK